MLDSVMFLFQWWNGICLLLLVVLYFALPPILRKYVFVDDDTSDEVKMKHSTDEHKNEQTDNNEIDDTETDAGDPSK